MIGVKETTPPSPKWENILGDTDQEERNSYNARLRDLKLNKVTNNKKINSIFRTSIIILDK